jgi:hypothetical protein
MAEEPAKFENCLVMVLMSSSVLRLLDKGTISPKQLAIFIRDQQQYISAPFKHLASVGLSFDFNFVQAVWRVDRDPTSQIAEALGTFVIASKNTEAFGGRVVEAGVPSATLHAGLDIGHVLIAGSRTLGEVITSAVAFAEEAVRRNSPVIMSRELYERVRNKHKKPLATYAMEVKGTVRRNREIVSLSLNDAEYLGEWEHDGR